MHNQKLDFHALVSHLEIIDIDSPDKVTLRELAQFEDEHNFQLPSDYKTFCQTLGSGRFGNHMRVYCPKPEFSSRMIQNMKASLEMDRAENREPENFRFFMKLLPACFVFANNPNNQDIVWDLNTYQETDDGYDIYLISHEPPDEIFFLGRSFLGFVKNFCVGDVGYQNLPAYLHPSEGDILPCFYQYSSNITSF
ncbi:SMI1/KNR4 family protein [Nodosilinea sp. LEGE 07088]|uniref:SMI1/KNR4 family protein n=1 Tax=Nodosilinea sp. LEGE 07088 TaxID=2777968 RepID=UPI001882ED8B|nr:SMI1/KNR4 family protein [Nodosilinea sp. LEGE 07088]MBE9139812.1 SMI1/KNR4 family protein [Nodosilinea sp. LEGE 07088]